MHEIADLISEKNDPEQAYELLDILGQGSYGSVHKALHKQTGQLYAIKILPATSGVEISAVKKQIGILKQCDDDHIVRYFGSYFKDNNLWIVMEYCIAGSVADIMQITKKKFNQFEIASILESVLYGLDYLHKRKKIHRDVKAANILLDQKGNAKLADFGVSASSMHTNARFRTHIGSPYWMSPEIIKFSQYTYKTDIWSLGITAVELAEGQVPNSHIKPFMALFMIKSNPVQSFKDPSLWSAQFNSFIKQCLQINSTNRPEAKQLLEHAFIKKYSKGQRLLSELVLSSIEQIQQFRMNQSNNSSFAQIIIDEGRSYAQETKTVVEGNSMIKKQINQDEDNQFGNNGSGDDQQNMEFGDGSMIIVQSECDKSNASMIDNSMIQYKDTKKVDPLTSYINGLKEQSNVQAKCMEKLVEALNRYDEELSSQLNKVFQNYKDKAEANILGLEGLKKNNPSLKVNSEYRCHLKSCKSLQQFLFPDQIASAKQNKIGQSLLLNSVLKGESDTTPNSKVLESKHIESTEIKSKDENFKKVVQEVRDPIKSFLIPNEADNRRFKKSYMQSQNSPLVESQGQAESTIQKPLSNAHNSSRIMIKRTDPNNLASSSQVKEMANDPQILEYLHKNNYLTSQSSITNHVKSAIQPAYTCTSLNSRAFFYEQKSTQKSKSKSKNKTAKNTKYKKPKVKLIN